MGSLGLVARLRPLPSSRPGGLHLPPRLESPRRVCLDGRADRRADRPGLGGGLYLNYVFTALWIGETVWWWASPHSYGTRSRTATLTVRAVFIFMIVNGAVVFVDGPMRWVGAGIVAALLATWMSHPARRNE